MSVLLPEPEGPMMATNSPAWIWRLTPSRAATRHISHAVDLGQIDGFDDCCGGLILSP